MKIPKLKKSSLNALNHFSVRTSVCGPQRGETWDELIAKGYVVPTPYRSPGSSTGQIAHSITPNGLRLLADLLEKEQKNV
jgi:hypothetical protein